MTLTDFAARAAAPASTWCVENTGESPRRVYPGRQLSNQDHVNGDKSTRLRRKRMNDAMRGDTSEMRDERRRASAEG